MEVAAATWTDIGTFAVAAATFGLLVAALFVAWHQINQSREATQAQLMADLSRRWDEEQLVESRRTMESYVMSEGLLDAIQRLILNHDPEYYVLVKIPNFFEDLKILYDRKGVRLDAIRDSLGGACIHHWRQREPAVKFLQTDRRQTYEHFEALAKLLEKEHEEPG